MENSINKQTYILIPSYEPEKELIPLVDSLFDLGFDIILVNDGSKKQYDEIFDQVKDKVIYLEQKPNKGKGAALRMGFSYANINNKDHNFVITVDGDGQHAVEDIVKISPFGNYIVTKKVKGEDIVKSLENGLSSYPEVAARFPQIAGITCTFNSKAKAGSRVVSVKIGGKDINLNEEYVLAINDFMSVGGDGYE